MDEQITRRTGDYGEPAPFSLRLRSIKSARQTLARILRERGKGNIDRETFRDLIYGMSHLLAFMKTEKELDIEERLQVIEDRLEAQR